MIYKRGKRWRVIVYAGRDPITGRKRQKSVTVATRAHAKQAEAPEELAECYDAIRRACVVAGRRERRWRNATAGAEVIEPLRDLRLDRLEQLPRMLTFTQTDIYLGLVPAARSADIPALIGWTGSANALWVAEPSAMLRSWEQRGGAQVVALLDNLYVSVAVPPLGWDHAEHLRWNTCWCARTTCTTW